MYPQKHQQTPKAISLSGLFFNAVSNPTTYAHLKKVDDKSGPGGSLTVPTPAHLVNSRFLPPRLRGAWGDDGGLIIKVEQIVDEVRGEGQSPPHQSVTATPRQGG